MDGLVVHCEKLGKTALNVLSCMTKQI